MAIHGMMRNGEGGREGGRGKLHDILTEEGKDCDMLRLSPRLHARTVHHTRASTAEQQIRV